MSEKLTVTIDFKGKEELQQIVETLLKKYNIDADIDLGSVAAEINKNVTNPLTKLKAQFAEWGLVLNGIKGTINTIGATYNQTIGTMIRASQEQESAETALKGALRATGLEVEQNSKVLQNYAASLQQATVHGDELLMTAMAQMQNIARFDNTETLMRATKAAIGLSAAFGIDLATAMDLVGKAGAGNTMMLSRYGIVLDETLGKADKFNQVINIGTGYFGLAADQAQTSAGSIQQLKNTWGDFQETLATGVLPEIKRLTNALKPLIEYATAMSDEQKAITIGLVLTNALIVKQTLVIMANKAAFAALTIEQQRHVASIVATVAIHKGVTLGTISFSAAMKGLGASIAAAGNALKGFMASIPVVGWIVLGITAAYVGLNAALKVNTGALKDKYDAEREALELKNESLMKNKDEEKSTLRMAERYEQLATKARLSKSEQGELSGIHQKLANKYPSLISATDSYSNSLAGVKGAADKARQALSDLDKQQWQTELRLAKNRIENNRIEAYEILSKEFNWRDMALTAKRSNALSGIYTDMQALLNNDSSVLSLSYLENLSKRLEDLGKSSKTFNNQEQAALQRASTMVNIMIAGKQRYNALLKDGIPREDSSIPPGEGGTDKSKEDKRKSLLEEIAAFNRARQVGFDAHKVALQELETEYNANLKLVKGNAEAEAGLFMKYEQDKRNLKADYLKADEDAVKQYYEAVKFYDADYYSWKRKQIDLEAGIMFVGNESGQKQWAGDQVKNLDKEQKEFGNRVMLDFEGQYEAEMSHLAELRDLGLVTYQEIAKKAWEYYNALKAIVEADGEVSEAEQKLLDVYMGRAQKAQLAVNRESDLASYYNQVKFLDSGYYEWKKARIEEDVRLMQVSEDQKAVILKLRMRELNAERISGDVQMNFRGKLLNTLGINAGDQEAIVGQYQHIAGQISAIWGQMYSNLEAAKNSAFRNLEQRAKAERKSEAWLSAEKEKINAEYEKKVRTMKRIEQKVQIASAMMNTAEGVTNALTQKPAWYAVPAAIAIGTLGAAQVGLIASQKFAEGGQPGLFRGKGTTTSDSNIIAISDSEYIIAADRVRALGVPFFDALNFGNIEQVGRALASIKMPSYNPANVSPKSSYNTGGQVTTQANHNQVIQVTLECDGRTLARAVDRGNRRIIKLN
jgi:hypothetical protein